MRRIKLPGTLKSKKILLIILVIIAIAILIKTGIDNRKVKTNREKAIEEQRLEDERIENEQEKVSKLLEEKEQGLYDEAYNAFFGSSDYKLTIEKANILLEQFPESYKGYNIRGIAKAYDGSFEEGMKDIDKSLELNSEYAYAKFNKALNYELYNNLDEALIWYDRALEIEEYVWSYYGKASIYGRRGDAENTVIYLKKAIDLAEKSGEDNGVKEEAKTESDFDPVRGNKEFENLIKT